MKITIQLVLFFFLGFLHGENRFVVSNFYGDWIITGSEQYRGGITTEQEAIGYVGKIVKIDERGYQSPMGEKANPKYEITLLSNDTKEGLVNDRLPYYSEKFEKWPVSILKVFSKKGLYTKLEILSLTNLVNDYDGRYYFLTKRR